jgi:type III secretion protein L
VVTEKELGLLAEAESLLYEAARKADETLEAAAEEYARQKEKGYQDGMEACQEECAGKLLEAALSSIEYIEGLEKTIVGLVAESAALVIGEMESGDRIVRIVRKALSNIRGQRRVTVRVSAGEAGAVRGALSAMTEGGGAAFLDVVGDPRLEDGSCLLESPLGVVDAGLETQLRAIRKAFGSRITERQGS